MAGHRVYLVRHARAESKAASDAERRLTPEGRTQLEQHVRALSGRLRVSRVVTSPFRRARETAAILARECGGAVTEDARLAAGACDGEALLALVREVPAGTALVGHNPEIAEALAALAGRDVEVKPGAVAALDVSGREVALAWLEVPER